MFEWLGCTGAECPVFGWGIIEKTIKGKKKKCS